MLRRSCSRLGATLRRRAQSLIRTGVAVGARLLPEYVAARSIPLLRLALGFQISARAFEAAHDRLRSGGKLLVFGLGKDSSTWELINRHGRTAFVEDLPEWIDFSKRQSPAREVHAICYETERDQSLRYTAPDQIPLPALPQSVASTRWDVVVVDGPRGYEPGQPGRASSIALAARLVAPGGVVMIDDFDRPLERHICQLVFGRQADRVLDPGRPVGVYDV